MMTHTSYLTSLPWNKFFKFFVHLCNYFQLWLKNNACHLRTDACKCNSPEACVCSEKNKSIYYFSTQIDFTNLYVASLVYLSRKNMRLGPYSKARLSKDVFFVCIFPQQKSQHNFLRTRI